MLNNVAIMGRITAAPDIKYTNSGIAVCSFTVAVQRDYDKNATDFFGCIAWRKTAEFVGKYFVKGEMIAVHGRLQTRSWEDNSGTTRRVTEIVVDNAYFCGNKKEYSSEKYQDVELEPYEETAEDGDLPF